MVMTVKPKDQSYEDFEMAIWKERSHIEDGYVVLPAIAMMKAVSAAAKQKSEKKAGKGNATWTKHFERGILITENIRTNKKESELAQVGAYCNPQGDANGGKRVLKIFPTLKSWEAEFQVAVLDDEIPKEKLEEYIDCAGKFIGIGQNRPQNKGVHGRFEVVSCKWAGK